MGKSAKTVERYYDVLIEMFNSSKLEDKEFDAQDICTKKGVSMGLPSILSKMNIIKRLGKGRYSWILSSEPTRGLAENARGFINMISKESHEEARKRKAAKLTNADTSITKEDAISMGLKEVQPGVYIPANEHVVTKESLTKPCGRLVIVNAPKDTISLDSIDSKDFKCFGYIDLIGSPYNLIFLGEGGYGFILSGGGIDTAKYVSSTIDEAVTKASINMRVFVYEDFSSFMRDVTEGRL